MSAVVSNDLDSDRPLVVSMDWVGGGLRTLLTGHLLPESIYSVKFVCWPTELGVLAMEVLLCDAGRPTGKNILDPQLHSAFVGCFRRFWRRAVVEWPKADAPPETWEWSRHTDALVCATRSPDVSAAKLGGRVRDRHQLRVVMRRNSRRRCCYESSA